MRFPFVFARALLATYVASTVVSRPLRAAPNLVHFTKIDKAPCRWLIHDIANDSDAKQYLATDDCPTHVVWDAKSNETIFLIERTLFRHRWGSSAKPERIASLPATYSGDNTIYDARLVVSKASSALRFVFLAPVAEDHAKVKAGRKQYVVEGEAYAAESFGSIGLPHLASIYDLGGTATWTRVKRVPTNWAAGETLGFAAVADELKERVDTSTLAGLECDEGSGDALNSKELPAKLKGKLAEDVTRFAWHANAQLFGRLVFGDLPHVSTPLFLCRDQGCVEPKKLEAIADGTLVSLCRHGSYLLIRPEIVVGPTRAYVYKATESKPVRTLDDVFRVAWLPNKVAMSLLR